MRYRDCMIAWTPESWGDLKNETAGQVRVGPHPDTSGWSDKYALTTGACYLGRKSMPRWQQIALMFTDFHQIVVRDGIDPQAVHQAFLAIDEYRHTISPDIAGAVDPEDEA